MIHPEWKKYADWLAVYHNAISRDELVYLSAPYSRVGDKETFMRQIMTFSGQLMLNHPGQHVCSPLFNHFSLAHVPELGTDYAFWKAYSVNMLKRCDRLLVVCAPGWKDSTGVADEVRIATELGMDIDYVSYEIFTAVARITEVLAVSTNPQTAN